ncbi:MAG: hypothetical protein Q9216_001026 [Gyalolechia sp. 2 TL-2023]
MLLPSFGIACLVYFVLSAHCIPVTTLPLKNLTTLTNDDPDLSPLVYHVPGTPNSIYVRPHDYPLPESDFEYAIWRARVYVTDKIASARGKANVPLPPDQDPKTYGSDMPVQISWQSSPGKKLTWGILAAVMRGLDDCLVKNNHVPYVAVWHVFSSEQEGEVGWGMISKGTGKVNERPDLSGWGEYELRHQSPPAPVVHKQLGIIREWKMHTPTGDGDNHQLPLRAASTQSDRHPSLPPPPSPSADTSIVPQITSPTKESQDLGLVPQNDDLDIFVLSPLAALKMLINTAEALIKITGDVPPTPPLSASQPLPPRVVSTHRENQPTHSRSSSVDRRKSQPPPPQGWEDAGSVPERAKTPIGSPESKPTEPLHVVGVVAESLDIQHDAVARKFYSKKPPAIPLEEYLLRLHKWCPLSTGVYLATGLYIYRLAVIQRSVPVTSRNAHRFLLAALRVAGKAIDDRSYPHKRFARVGGVTERELARLEIAFCYVTDFELRVTREMLEKHARLARDQGRMYKSLIDFRPRMPAMLDKRQMSVKQMEKEIVEKLTMLLRLLLPAILTSFACADVQFTSPAAGGTLPAGRPITARWKDSGDGTALSDLKTYTLFLCAGGNDAESIIQLAPINANGQFSTGNEASATVAATVGGPDKNAYFLKIQSVGTDGTQVVNYSDRFTLSGMTGSFPPEVQAGIEEVSGTDGPPSTAQDKPAAGAGAEGDFAVTYTAQTGLIKYAPMQVPPGTKITLKSAKPRYPTSSVSIAKTFLPTPKQTTTMTASQTHIPPKSRPYQAPAASMPAQNDMQKFLNRWRD